MSNENNSIKFIDGKVLFSKEIIEYFESIRTEENSEWIDKYFEVLNDESNLNAVKFNMHHIRPCFTFKNKNHRNRKETQKLGDAFNGNIIKLSLYNHLLAHYYLWKIYNEWNSKKAIQQMSFQKKYTNDLSEDEIKIIAKFREDCAKENQTREELKEYGKQWYENNKERKLKKNKEWIENNYERYLQKRKEWELKNKDKRKQQIHNYYENNKEKIAKLAKERNEQNKEYLKKYREEYYKTNKEEINRKVREKYKENKDKISKKHKEYRENNKKLLSKKAKERYKNNKELMLKQHKEWYKNNKEKVSKTGKRYYETNKKEILIKQKIRYNANKEKLAKLRAEYAEEKRKYTKEYNSQLCFDPIKKEYINLGVLVGRKRRNKELYKDINPKDYIVKK